MTDGIPGEFASPDVLRRRAEVVLPPPPTNVANMSEKDLQALVHELQVHQIELQLQNEELRRAQQELASSLDRYTDLYEFAPVGYATLDAEGRILNANLTLASALGLNRTRLVGTKFSAYVAPQSQDCYFLHRRKVFAEDVRCVCEVNLVPASKQPLCVRLESVAFADEGTPYCRTAVIDVSERKRTEQALRSSEERLRTILNTAADAIITVDAKGVIASVNPATTSMFGYGTEELVGKEIEVLMPFPYCDVDDSCVERYVEEEDVRIISVSSEAVGCRKDGSTFPVELAVSQVGNLGLFAGVVRDVTQRKASEQELSRSRDRLRDLAIHLQSSREQERISIAREIHDELGQLLTAMKMDLVWLRKNVRQDRARLLTRCDSVVDLITQCMKTVSRLTARLRPNVLDHLGLTAAILREADQFQERSGVRVSLEIADNVNVEEPLVTTIFRICQEALTNVARHACASEVVITLKQDVDMVVLCVSDNGRGMSTERMNGPTAYGLIGMRERVLYCKGELKVRSHPGAGTTVTVTLPNTCSADEETNAEGATEHDSHSTG
jgi:PAS domain S-box-containing protein